MTAVAEATRARLVASGQWARTKINRDTRWMWAVPAAVALAVYLVPPRWVEVGVALLVGLALVGLTASAFRALGVLIVVFPFQTFVFSALYAAGLPAAVVRPLGFWKEAVVGGLVLAAVRAAVRRRPVVRLDILDWMALAYVALVSAYLLLPQYLGDGTVRPLDTRLLAYRADVVFVVLFLAARHLGAPRMWLPRLATVVFRTGTVAAAVAVFELAFLDQWRRIAVLWFEVTAYRVEVLGAPLDNPLDVALVADRVEGAIVRAGSVLLDPLALGLFLVLPLAIGFERIVRRRASPPTVAGTVVIAAGLCSTQTRTGMVAALVAIVLIARPAPGRYRPERARLVIWIGFGVALALPVIMAIGLANRSTTGVVSAGGAIDKRLQVTQEGLEALVAQPLGRGLGSSPTAAMRSGAGDQVPSENYYLQVANELGVQTMIVFVAFVVLAARRLRAVVDGTSASELAAATRAALIGLSLAAFALHVWLDLVVAWTFWAVAGAVIGALAAPPRSAAADGKVLVPARAAAGR